MNREKACEFAVLLGSVAARVEHHPSKQIILELAHLAPRARVRPLLEDAPNAVAHQVLDIRAQVEIVGEGRNKVAEVCLRAPTPDSVQCRLRFESTRKRGRKEERERGQPQDSVQCVYRIGSTSKRGREAQRAAAGIALYSSRCMSGLRSLPSCSCLSGTAH